MDMIDPGCLAHITGVTTEEVGGGMHVDFVHLIDGRVIGINEDAIVLYRNMDDFWNATPEDKPAIYLTLTDDEVLNHSQLHGGEYDE